jgi:hypothetical protein
MMSLNNGKRRLASLNSVSKGLSEEPVSSKIQGKAAPALPFFL